MTGTGIERLKMGPTDKSILRDFVRSWAPHGGLVVFVGAGFSAYQADRLPSAPASSRFGTWWDMQAEFVDKLSGGNTDIKKSLPTDPLRLAELFEIQFTRRALLDLVARHVPAVDFEPGPAHLRLRDLPLTAIVTGNYDDLLERSFVDQRPIRRIVQEEDLTAPAPRGALTLVKMHGDLSRPDTIILAEEKYRTYEQDRPGIALKVKQLLLEHPVLFLGFSLSDPNFVKIDGWIRDTVRELKLAAVAIVHGAIRQADQDMWKRRGISLVGGPGSKPEMADLLAAMAEEWRAHSAPVIDPPLRNERVASLMTRVRELIETDAPDVKAIAKLLGEIVDGAGQDADGGKEARREASRVAHGWHSLLDVISWKEPRVRRPEGLRLRDIYDALAVQQQIGLLKLALEEGELQFRFEPGHELDVPEELLRSTMTTDDRALVYLHKAKIHRERGEAERAEDAIKEGRKVSGVSAKTRDRLAEEYREILFLLGDADRLARELRAPLALPSDVTAMCRRGSDYLLLGDREAARAWYEQALRLARNGDQKYVARWGGRAATMQLHRENFEVHQDFWRDIQAMRDEDRPAIEALEKHRMEAARRALEGRGADEVVWSLDAYLAGLRAVGWPHSVDHNATFQPEEAARQAGRLLLADHAVDDRRIDRIKEGLTLLNIYGLATEVAKLFKDKHLSLLRRSPSGVAWFRAFAANRPTLPRSNDARLITALCGLPLLEDSAINALVDVVAAHAEAMLVGGAENELLPECWKAIGRHAEHLPAPAAKRILNVAIRCAESPLAARRLEPEAVARGLWLWMRTGALEARVSDDMAAVAERAFSDSVAANDSWTMRSISRLLEAAVRAGIVTGGSLERVVRAGDGLLGQVIKNRKQAFDEVGWLLVASGQGFPSREALASLTVSQVRRDLSSSTLGITLDMAKKLLPFMGDDDRTSLLDLLLEEAAELPKRRNIFGGRASIVGALCALGEYEPNRRSDIARTVQELVELDPARFGHHVDLHSLYPAGGSDADRMARLLLLTTVLPRRWRMGVVGAWLAKRSASPERWIFVDMLVGLMLADEPETRRAAIDVIRNTLTDLFSADHDRRARVVATLLQLATCDDDWMVRGAALQGLVALHDGGQLADLRALLDDAAKGDVAILRRMAELCIAKLDGNAAGMNDT